MQVLETGKNLNFLFLIELVNTLVGHRQDLFSVLEAQVWPTQLLDLGTADRAWGNPLKQQLQGKGYIGAKCALMVGELLRGIAE